MKITLKNKEYPLNFGIRFIHELDKLYNFELGGIEYGTGVNMAFIKLQSSDPYALFQVLQCALKGNIELNEEDFDDWVVSLESDKSYAAFFKELVKNLEIQRMTGQLIKTYKENLKKLEKKTEKEITKAQNELTEN